MNERLVEDWLAKVNERSYQIPFAQSLVAEGMDILRVGHGSHEHGKDIIAVDENGRIHAYQLKDGNLDVGQFERGLGQITALVETQVEHPAISGHPHHLPWLVISGQTSMPVEDRIRVHNLNWKKRGYKPLGLINGAQLLKKFTRMAANFWPMMPEDSRSLFNLYLADGRDPLDRGSLANLVVSTAAAKRSAPKTETARRLCAANLFASYALSPFYRSENHWELVQGWTITAAQIAWIADRARLREGVWRATFRLAVGEALTSLYALADEALKPHALGPGGLELDELTRSRCTICAGAIAVRLLLGIRPGARWDQERTAKEMLERLFSEGRLVVWGESAVPFFLAVVWALDNLRGDLLSDKVFFSVLSAVVHQNSRISAPKLPPPHDSADEANAKALRRLFEKQRAMETQAAASYTLEPLVMLGARRMWRNVLATLWPPITKTDIVRLVPDKPEDLLLWNWGYKRGSNQTRLFNAPQSWSALLDDSRRSESDALPKVLRQEFDFALLFLLCFPHRLTRAVVKHLEEHTMSSRI
jgi:hypothetical protein